MGVFGNGTSRMYVVHGFYNVFTAYSLPRENSVVWECTMVVTVHNFQCFHNPLISKHHVVIHTLGGS